MIQIQCNVGEGFVTVGYAICDVASFNMFIKPDVAIVDMFEMKTNQEDM